MSIGRELLNDLTERLENPLANIGLTEEILSLDLTTEELYEVSRKFAKTLLAIVHEDRVTPTERTKALQARFSAAMTSLRDVETFTAALGSFKRRTQKAKAELAQERNDRAEMSALNNRAQAELGEALLRVKRIEAQLGIEKQQISYIQGQHQAKSKKMLKKVLEAELAGRIVAREELKVTKKVLMDLRATAKERIRMLDVRRKIARRVLSEKRLEVQSAYTRSKQRGWSATRKLREQVRITRTFSKKVRKVSREELKVLKARNKELRSQLRAIRRASSGVLDVAGRNIHNANRKAQDATGHAV